MSIEGDDVPLFLRCLGGFNVSPGLVLSGQSNRGVYDQETGSPVVGAAIDADGNIVMMQGKGRHDPCVVPRAVPIVEALSALVLADFLLLNKARR